MIFFVREAQQASLRIWHHIFRRCRTKTVSQLTWVSFWELLEGRGEPQGGQPVTPVTLGTARGAGASHASHARGALGVLSCFELALLIHLGFHSDLDS